jgi:surface antigen
MIEAFAHRREGRMAAAARLAALASGLAAAGLSLCGCSMSIPGFIDAAPTGALRTPFYPFAQEDWAKAEPALLAAIRAGVGAEPAPWSNEASGRSGVVVGVGTRFAKDGATCRAFVARITDNGTGRDVEGSACEKAGEVRVSDAGPFPKV